MFCVGHVPGICFVTLAGALASYSIPGTSYTLLQKARAEMMVMVAVLMFRDENRVWQDIRGAEGCGSSAHAFTNEDGRAREAAELPEFRHHRHHRSRRRVAGTLVFAADADFSK